MDSADSVLILAMIYGGLVVLIVFGLVLFNLKKKSHPGTTIRVHSENYDQIWDTVLKSLADLDMVAKSDKDSGTLRSKGIDIRVSKTLSDKEFEIIVKPRGILSSPALGLAESQKIISCIELNLK